MVEFVPTLNDTLWDANQMFGMWRRLGGGGQRVEFDFSNCRFLRQNAVAFLGGLARLIEYRDGQVVFRWQTMDSAIAANLGQNGFMSAFAGPQGPWRGNSIPYREDNRLDAHGFSDYLTGLWLGRDWINISPALRDAITGRVAEIYLNAFEHSESPVGVLSCGQHFPKKKELNLTIVDFGVGIPSNVRLYKVLERQPEQLTAPNCMEWAFQNGSSTKQGNTSEPRGLGLDLLHDFMRNNGGRLEMFSHEGYASIVDGKISFAEQNRFFEGTMVNISLKCDESYYCLASEIDKEPLF
jgi:hypothetical protein